jgi:hypothetical protein
MNKLFFLFIILLITISLPLFYYSSSLSRESYVNLDLGKYPNSVNEVYLQNDYPITKKMEYQIKNPVIFGGINIFPLI